MEANTDRKRPKPTSFDELYPGRFIKAGELRGKKVTVTISDVDVEELVGDAGEKKLKAIISFKESEKKLVACKTNGICIKAMFGSKVSDWIGHKIVIFPDQWNGEPCVRVWGSPDIERDLDVEVSLPRRRPFKKTMHRTAPGQRGGGAPSRDPSEQDADPENDGRDAP